ncbi:MAG: beta-lactamase family protein [Proteobacteria bacterium]|nr:beta-lactamase family protein [Pseudomonadota bacterium]
MHALASLARATIRRALLVPLCASLALPCAAALAAPAADTPRAQAVLPDSPTGRLAGELLRRVATDSPRAVRDWVPTILSADIAAGDSAAFAALLASTARDSGGLDVFDVRTNPRQPGLLQVAVQARHGGRRGLLVLAADETHPDRLAVAELVPMDDPALYADWPAQALSQAALAQLIRAKLDQLVRTNDFSGCVSVSDGRNTIIDECRGLAERNFGTPVDSQTRFHVGSINKMFTAVAIAQLVEAGKLSWDDTLAMRVPEYPDQAMAAKITLWQLLHHTSGLGDFIVPEYFEHPERFVDPADHLDLIARQPRLGAPGEGWNYSNSGYMLLGRVIENASGEAYADYIRRHVFAPAQMNDSGFDSLDEVIPRLAVGYYRDSPFSSARKAAWFKTLYQSGPAGGGYSTNADLLRFAEALRTGKLVDPATLATMFEDAVPAGPGGYAAGFGDRLSHGRHIRGHSGGAPGTDANLAIVWETGATVALTSNQGEGQAWLFSERIADLMAMDGAGQ